MKGDRVAAFGRPHPRRSLTGEGDLLPAEARLVADHGPGAALALQAVAHGNARRLTLNRKVELPAAAGGLSGGHRSAPGCCNGRSVDGTSKRRIMRVNSRRILVRERAPVEAGEHLALGPSTMLRGRIAQCPLPAESDRLLHCRGMSRRAKSGLMHRSKQEVIRSPRRRVVAEKLAPQAQAFSPF